jgi:uncharacterized damage-inducible protein DinB
MVLVHLVAEWQHEAAQTRKLLEAIPKDKLSWKPHPKSYSVGELGTHIATIGKWGVITAAEPSYNIQLGERFAEPVKDKEELLHRFDEHSKAFREALEKLGDEDLAEPWELRAGGRAVFTLPRGAVFRSFIFSHLIHHRGQLSVYLRLLDVPVPGVYGPSADER